MTRSRSTVGKCAPEHLGRDSGFGSGKAWGYRHTGETGFIIRLRNDFLCGDDFR